MTLRNELSLMTYAKLEHTKYLLNLSEEETKVFDMLAKNKNIAEISLQLNLSSRTVDRIIQKIKYKLKSI